MELTTEALGTGFVGLVIILGALGQYLRSLRAARPPDPGVLGVGLELGTRLQMDQLIAEVRRIGDILENKKQSAMEAMLEDLTDKVDEMRKNR